MSGGFFGKKGSGIFSSLSSPSSFTQKSFDSSMNALMSSSNRDKFIKAAQTSNNADEFMSKSGLSELNNAYKAAYDAAPTKLYYTGTNREADPKGKWANDSGWSGYEKYSDGEVEYRKDLSGISSDLSNAYKVYNNKDQLTSWLSNARNEYGTLTENADAGAQYTGNVSAIGDSGSGAVSNTNGGGRRQGGDMVTGDSTRSSDNRGNDTLLGASGNGSLKDKETLF